MLPKHCFELFLLCAVISVTNAGRLTMKTLQETTTEDFSIVGGVAVSITEVPYQVSLQIQSFHYCGASVIAANVVLTAAHCFGYPSEYYQVRAGSSLNYTGGTVVKVARMESHPDEGCDVGLVWLSQDLEFGPTIQKVELAQLGQELPSGTEVLVTGWGHLKFEGRPPYDSLQKVTVPIVDKQSCNASYDGYITNNMICAGYPEGGKDSCQGDSGGPLVYNKVQYGIVSFGRGCAEPRYPGVYSNIAAFRDWIDKAMKEQIY